MTQNNYDARITLAQQNGYNAGYTQALQDFKVSDSFRKLLNPVMTIKANDVDTRALLEQLEYTGMMASVTETISRAKEDGLTENEVRALLGDIKIVTPVKHLIDGGYNMLQIKHVFTQITLDRAKENYN